MDQYQAAVDHWGEEFEAIRRAFDASQHRPASPRVPIGVAPVRNPLSARRRWWCLWDRS